MERLEIRRGTWKTALMVPWNKETNVYVIVFLLHINKNDVYASVYYIYFTWNKINECPVFLHPHTPVFMVDDRDGLTGLGLRAILEISEWWYFHQISDVLEISVWYFLGNIHVNA